MHTRKTSDLWRPEANTAAQQSAHIRHALSIAGRQKGLIRHGSCEQGQGGSGSKTTAPKEGVGRRRAGYLLVERIYLDVEQRPKRSGHPRSQAADAAAATCRRHTAGMLLCTRAWRGLRWIGLEVGAGEPDDRRRSVDARSQRRQAA